MSETESTQSKACRKRTHGHTISMSYMSLKRQKDQQANGAHLKAEFCEIVVVCRI